MKVGKSLVVYKKELLETLRDKKTLVIMVVIPIVLYPLIFMLATQILSIGAKNLESEQSVVSLTEAVPGGLKDLLAVRKDIKMMDSKNPETALKEQTISAYVDNTSDGVSAKITVYYDGAVERSRLAQSRLNDVLVEYKRLTLERDLKKEGIDTKVLDAVQLDYKNTAPPSKMGGMFLGSIIPMLLIVTTALGAMYPAIDVTAGEKERGTLETILTVPVKKNELFLGKFMTVSTIAVITAALNLLSMLMVYSIGLIQMDVLVGDVDFSLSVGTVFILFVLTVPVSLFISALTMSGCLFAKSFKDAQNIVTPIYILLMIPAIFAMAPGIKLNSVLSIIPVLNVCLAFKDILLQSFSSELLFMVFISNLLFAFIGYLMVLKFFQAEEVLFADGRGFNFLTKRSEMKASDVFELSDALVITSILLVSLIYIGSMLQIKFGYYGILITQWVFILMPVLIATWYFKLDVKKVLHIKGFNIGSLIGSMVLGIGMIGTAIYIARFQMFLFPEMNDMEKAMEKMLDFSTEGISPWFGFFVFAITPAICEEIFFRGMLLSTLKKRISSAPAIIIVSIIFGIYHLSIFRILPTALVGAFLAYTVYKTGSIFLGMILHAINNGASVLLVLNPDWNTKLTQIFNDPFKDAIVLMSVFLMVALGVIILHLSNKDSKKHVRNCTIN